MEIHELKLHQSILVRVECMPNKVDGVLYPYVWQVTRVVGGWIYQDANPNINTPKTIFVPEK